ncbi:MAG: hypothetical protein G01um101448_635 [Parcubacteria group bacterium Gr01-1014_48]|nr:MAG: hypothetical protein Greene041614_975 [Parcubacteria group bacterium Greene0416_14]TSC73688.1 MAG: hypothetical protein G01um101448_635 [Parcubacteria group bacterium Gr01-1014_48]TSD00268.1 MAG: hypothetical protein Greene101415_927 [Parcubacteria group bacterium Greene1014_15]
MRLDAVRGGEAMKSRNIFLIITSEEKAKVSTFIFSECRDYIPNNIRKPDAFGYIW